MNFWILTVLRVMPKLAALCKKLDKRISVLSFTTNVDTYKIYEQIMELNDVKTVLINLKVLNDSFFNALNGEDKMLMLMYSKCYSLEDIACEFNIHKTTAMRRIHKAIKKCTTVALNLGYNLKRFERDYRDVPLISGTYNVIMRSHLSRSRAAASKNTDKELKIKNIKHTPKNEQYDCVAL